VLAHPRRIAFFMHDLSGGGVERMRIRLASALAARGHTVILIVQRCDGALTTSVPDCVSLVALGQLHTPYSVVPLARWLRVHRPDILISSLDHNNIAAILARALAMVPTRLVICQHNALSGQRALGWRYRLLPFLYRMLAHRADAVIAISAGVAMDLVNLARVGRSKITIIHNPVCDGIPCQPAIPAPHAWLNDPKTPTFVFAGRLVAQKDPVLLLEAFAHRLRNGAARLIILGEGAMQPVLERRAEDLGIAGHVHFAGFVADTRPWIAPAAAFVLTSRYEGFANVLVEALACGTPIIAADCPHGPAEILENGRYGRLVPVGDIAAFAAAMDEDLRALFPPALLQDRASLFSVTECVRRHEALFGALLARRRRTAFGLSFSGAMASSVAAQMSGAPPDRVRWVVTPNLEHIRLLRRPSFAASCRAADIVCADGFPVALYAWLRGAAPLSRITGCDIFHQLALNATQHPRRVLVIAESRETASVLVRWIADRDLQERWYVETAKTDLADDAASQQSLVASVRAVQPEILVMTLGAPVSEEFVARYHAEMPPCWVLCVGQAVRVELGLVRRAPVLLRRCGLEWAWRVRQEPARLGVRYLRAASWFPVAVIADLLWCRRGPDDYQRKKEGQGSAVDPLGP
jgi:exopolysaccharide biosynthesis WecB/TagA/CpsF family protein